MNSDNKQSENSHKPYILSLCKKDFCVKMDNYAIFEVYHKRKALNNIATFRNWAFICHEIHYFK